MLFKGCYSKSQLNKSIDNIDLKGQHQTDQGNDLDRCNTNWQRPERAISSIRQ